MIINEEKLIKINTNDCRDITTNHKLKIDFNNNYRTKKQENLEDLKFNIQSLKNSTDSLIQSIINNNKYLIEYEKNKQKENPEDEEEMI